MSDDRRRGSASVSERDSAEDPARPPGPAAGVPGKVRELRSKNASKPPVESVDRSPGVVPTSGNTAESRRSRSQKDLSGSTPDPATSRTLLGNFGPIGPIEGKFTIKIAFDLAPPGPVRDLRGSPSPLDERCSGGSRNRAQELEIDGVDGIGAAVVVRIPEIGRIGQHDAAQPCLPVGIVVATGSISEKASNPVSAEIFQAGDIAIDATLKDVTESAGLEVPREVRTTMFFQNKFKFN